MVIKAVAGFSTLPLKRKTPLSILAESFTVVLLPYTVKKILPVLTLLNLPEMVKAESCFCAYVLNDSNKKRYKNICFIKIID